MTDKQVLEAIADDDSLFDLGISAEDLKIRKISTARVLNQARKAFDKATATGQDELAKQLQDKINILQDWLDDIDSSKIDDSPGDDPKPDTRKKDNPDNPPSDDPRKGGGRGDSKGGGGGNPPPDDPKELPENPPEPPKPPENPPEPPKPPEEPPKDPPKPPKPPENPPKPPENPPEPPENPPENPPEPPEDPPKDPPEPPKPPKKPDEIKIDPFRKPPISPPPVKPVDPSKVESVFDAAKRILGGLSGEAKKGASQGLKDLLASRGVKVEESFNAKLTESHYKPLAKLSDDEFHDELAATMALVDQVIDVKYSDDLDDRVAEIMKDADNKLANLELDREDRANLDAERKAAALKAKEEEKEKYKHIEGLPGLEDFQETLFNAIDDQVDIAEDDEESWAALDRRHEDDPSIIKKGYITDDIERDIPSVYVYFDQSGSWTDAEDEIGKRAVSVINKFDEDGQIKLEMFYISAAGVCTSASVARSDGSAEGWAACLQHIRDSQAKNVVILSDDDLDCGWFDWSNRPTGDNGLTVVDGCVWWLWKNGSVAKKALKELVGRSGNFQYKFSTRR